MKFCSQPVPLLQSEFHCEAGLENAFRKVQEGEIQVSCKRTRQEGWMEAMVCGLVYWLNLGTPKHSGCVVDMC